MAFSLVIDDTSLVLLLTIIGLLVVGLFLSKAYQPLVHPLILSRQSDVSPVRYQGQSSVYRNANSPAGFEMGSQPRRAIWTSSDAVRRGAGGNDWTDEHERTLYDDDKCSNQKVFRRAYAFGQGMARMANVDLASLALAVCAEVDSAESVEATLSGDVQSEGRYTPLVIAPAYLKSGHPPTTLPFPLFGSRTRKGLDAVFTTAVAFKRASQMPIVDQDTIFVLKSEDEAEEVRKVLRNKAVSFDEVVRQCTSSPPQEQEQEKRQGSAESGESIHSSYWTGRSGWVDVSNASLIAGLTAQLCFFPADQQPTHADHLFVEQAPNIESHSLRLAAASTPSGLVTTLLALYTNAGLTAGTLTSSYSDWNPAASESIARARPTVIVASSHGASSLAACLCSVTKRSPLASLAAHTKLSTLRHGIFGQNSFWDSALFNKVRSMAGCDRIRSVLIVSEGPTVGQGLLDLLRAQLGCSVRLAYLPANPLRLYDESIQAGVASNSTDTASDVRFALPTAPICVTHSLDLQAFAAHVHDKRQLPAHVGPPNVTVAMKLVETQLATSNGLSVNGLSEKEDAGRANDPFGELFVRGNCIAGATSSEQWCATNDLGTVRSNGTFIVLQDKNKSAEVETPTLSSEYPSSRRTSRIGAGGAPTRSVPLLSVMLLAIMTLFCADVSSAAASPELHQPYSLVRRADSINATFVNTAIMSFMNAQRASWEQGVAQSALLEYYGGSWGVFSGSSAPEYLRENSRRSALPSNLMAMAHAAVNSQDGTGQLCSRVTGDESATEGSALDPAACGEVVLLAAYANGQLSNGQLSSDGKFSRAAQRQLSYLLNNAPRTPSGAISMRSTGESYWSDGVYMAPPFIALYGLMTNNQTLLQTAYDQIRLYRDALRITSGPAQGLFMHIVNATSATSSGQDLGAWLTGNAWSAAGMCRVLASIAQSPYASSMSDQQDDLVNWTDEILSVSLGYGTPLMHNYINETDTFQDAGGSAMIAYSAFRLASIVPAQNLTAQLATAESIFQTVQNKLGPDGQMISGTNVVNPLTFTTPSQGSPEGMAFLVLMSAARRDHMQGNVTSLSGPSANGSSCRSAQRFTLSGLLALGLATASCTIFL